MLLVFLCNHKYRDLGNNSAGYNKCLEILYKEYTEANVKVLCKHSN